MSNKVFPRLYTLDSKSKIRVFDCKVESGMSATLVGDTFESSSTDGICITTATGLLGGKLVEQRTFVKQGKNKGKSNESTPLSQALLEADSLWREKWQEGYKSIENLENKLKELNIL